MILTRNWSINRKISIATALAVALSVLLLVFMNFQQSKSEIHRLAKQNYTLISELLATQASGAMRWKKTDLVEEAYSHIAGTDGSTLASLIAIDPEGGVISLYNSKSLLQYDLSTLLAGQQSKKEMKVVESKGHLVFVIPVYSGKKSSFVGTLALAWSLQTSNEDIKNSQIKNGMVGIVIIVGLILLLIYLTNTIVIKPLNQMISLTQDLAEGEGDLSKRIQLDREDEFALLTKWINLFVEKVHQLVGQVKEASTNLNDESATLASTVEKGNIALEEQKRDVEQVVTAINQMTATVVDVSQNASEAAQAAREASTASNKAQEVVNDNISSITSLEKEVDTSAVIIESLEKDAENIGSVLDVIKSIAEQTNLLALNAAIEAARAGDQGRGFAVVADEVRTLASRTQESTQEIEQMIERLQNGASNAVSAMHQGKEKASVSVSHSNRVKQALLTIIEHINKINDMNTQIATAAEEQSSVTEEINRNVHNVNSLFVHSVENSQQSANTSASVANLASELQNMIAQFKV